jgi:cytidylate kinase
MTTGSDLAKCLSFISCHVTPPSSQGPHESHALLRPAITLSRQTGSGAMHVARALAAYLQQRQPVRCAWTVFDKNLVAKMLEEHNLPEQLARFLPEDRISRIRDVVEELLGLHPPSETLVRQIGETVVHLAEMGNAILVGRAANLITRHMKNVFHVRLVAPIEKRVAQIVATRQISPATALEFLKKEDAARKGYLREFFHHDPDDVLLYDLVVNTARLTPEQAAHLIGDAVLEWAKGMAMGHEHSALTTQSA